MHRGHHALQHRVEELTGFFGVTVGQQGQGAFEVGKQHGDVLALAFQGGARGQDLLGQMGRHGRKDGVGLCLDGRRWRPRCPSPDQDVPSLVAGKFLCFDEFGFEVFEVLIIEVEASFEGPIRDAPLALEHVNHTGQDFVKRHG